MRRGAGSLEDPTTFSLSPTITGSQPGAGYITAKKVYKEPPKTRLLQQ